MFEWLFGSQGIVNNRSKYPVLYAADYEEVIKYTSDLMQQTMFAVRRKNSYILILPSASDCFNTIRANARVMGTDIVEASYFKGCCSECAKRRGRWFSLSGKDKRFPAINLNYDCSCTGLDYYPVIPGISEPSYKRYYKRAMVDDRSQKEIATYNKTIAEFKSDFVKCAKLATSDFDFKVKTCTLIR